LDALRVVDGLCQRLGWLLLPPDCVLCGARGLPGLDLCAGCRDALPANAVACPRCALPLLHAAPACGACLSRPPPFEAAWAAWRCRFVGQRRFAYHVSRRASAQSG
jgi:predicted amidophosphoribosyltransferase